jgi:cytidylate kinase-like protein
VCISRDFGAGGEEVGRMAAEQLGFRYVDEEIVARAAAKGSLDPAAVADAERRQPLIHRLLDAIAEGSIASPEAAAYVPELLLEPGRRESAAVLIRAAVRETAAQGGAVIVAHGGSHTLDDRDDVLRVLVTGSEERRADRIGEDTTMTGAEIRQALREAEKARADYLRRFHGVAEERPTHYDLVLNTDALGVERCAGVVVAAARS